MKQYRNTDYYVTKNGRVYSKKSGKYLSLNVIASGYLKCEIWHDKQPSTLSVHRMVAHCYIPNPDNKPQVNHIDGDKTNNHVSNLEWNTAKENLQHALDNGLRNISGVNNGRSKLTAKQVEEIRQLKGKHTQREIAQMYGVHRSQIGRIHRNQTQQTT